MAYLATTFSNVYVASNRTPPSLSTPSKIKKTQNDVNYVAQKSLSNFTRLMKGLGKSPVVRGFAINLAIAAALVLIFHFVFNPIPAIAALLSINTKIATGLLATGITVTLIAFDTIAYFSSKKLKQYVDFECSAFWRLLRGIFKNNFNQIDLNQIDDHQNKKIFLGALPNRLQSETILDKLGNGAVLAVNEKFELEDRGVSIPFSEQDWKIQGIDYKYIEADDHVPLDITKMQKASDFINQQLTQGRPVLVHCRGGVGRSATGIAAYLMDHATKDGSLLSLEEICCLIKKSRPGSTIFNKVLALKAYDDSKNRTRTKSSDKFEELFKFLENQINNGKKPKAKKSQIREIMEQKDHYKEKRESFVNVDRSNKETNFDGAATI